MIIQQISAFLENRTGQLQEMMAILSGADINIHALNIAETADYGIVRIIVEDAEKAAALLREGDVLVNITPVVAAAVPDEPGGLLKMLDILQQANVDISYLYSVFGHGKGTAHIVFRTEEPERTDEILKQGGIETDVIRKKPSGKE